jgi:hypothetical protein
MRKIGQTVLDGESDLTFLTENVKSTPNFRVTVVNVNVKQS